MGKREKGRGKREKGRGKREILLGAGTALHALLPLWQELGRGVF